ncbi:MAG TPA: CHAT domain-containing tetratricopeptide repeat protein, partial [Symbiobacteriaceae bacterium]|nr:CHAT domain-containing tetratricopeptide repeat protein [Symbiobacteriaceae bacterium]
MMLLSEGAGPLARALALRAHCTTLRMQNRMHEALEAAELSAKLWLENGEEVEWARTIIGTIPILVQMDRNKQAIAVSEAALALLIRIGELPVAARLLANMGAMYGNMGRPLDALRCFTQGEEFARRLQQSDLHARFNTNRALVLQQLGRHEESISACARALWYYMRKRESISQAKSLQAGAIALFHLGRFGKALRRFAKARELFEEVSSARDVAVCDLYIAACYLELNRYDETLGRLAQVTGVLDPEKFGFQHAWANLYQGVALARTGRTDSARQSLAAAVRWFETQGHTAWAGKARLEEADLLLGLDLPRKAVRAAASAARLFADAHMPAEKARAHLLMAESSLKAGRPKQARAAADGAYPVFMQARMPGPLFRTLHLLGRIAMRQRDWSAAHRYLTRAVGTAERVRATVQVAFRKTFLADKATAYADLVWLNLSRGRVRQAHRLVDLAKSRALADTLAASPTRHPGRTRPRDLELLAEIESVRREYQALMAPARLGPEVAVFLRGGSATASARRAELEQRLGSLWDEWELRQAASLAAPVNQSEGLAGVRRSLPAGACMLEYFVAGDHLAAFVTDRRGLRGWADLGSMEPVRRCLDLLRLNLDAALVTATAGRPTPPGLARNARSLLGELYRLLWEPAISLMGDPRSVVVIPHEALHLVPFEALHDGERYLVERVELSLAPSRAIWVRCQERSGNGADLVIGHDAAGALPYVNDEVRWVADALGARAWLGQEAAGSRLTGGEPHRIVHMAVHGEFRSDNPHFSTLMLADGPLTAADAARLDLQASLVILSGCETGLSRITRGEELMGMITAFLEAGSASVLASRWRVDDRVTARLMQQFYASLLAG